MASDIPRSPPQLISVQADDIETPAETVAKLRTATAELAGAVQNWPGRVPVRNSITSIIEAAASFDFGVAHGLGKAAFRPDDGLRRLDFSADAITKIRRAAADLSQEIRPGDAQFAAEMGALGERLFLFHELTHVAQNAGDYQTIQLLKQLSNLQVAQLDLVADLAAIRAAACIECAQGGSTSPKFFAAACVRIGIFCYALGVRAFGVSDEIKRARFLGVLLTSAATHAHADGMLSIPWLAENASVPPILPILKADGEFNAMVLERAAKLLLPRSCRVPLQCAADLCGDLAELPAQRAMSSCYMVLSAAGVIRTCAAFDRSHAAKKIE